MESQLGWHPNEDMQMSYAPSFRGPGGHIFDVVRNATYAPNKATLENCMETYYRNLYGRVVCHLFMMFFPVFPVFG